MKVIKELVVKYLNSEYIYNIGYFSFLDNIQIKLEIYRDEVYLGYGSWNVRSDRGSFYFNDNTLFFMQGNNKVDTIKEMFNKLKEYIEIPEEVEREYENILIMYKLI